jgi:ABC transport system ATP-binding/permease protein
LSSWQIIATVSREGAEHRSLRLTFDRSPVSIGAQPDNDILLDDPRVSGTHAHVVVSRGALTLYDRSRNGTFVGGQRVDRRMIASGTVVEIPPFKLHLELVFTGRERRHTLVAGVDTDGTLVLIEVILGPPELVSKRLPLPPGGILVGRGPECDLCVALPTLSRQHAEIRPGAAGTWEVRDLKSANGTFLNGTRVGTVALQSGDEIQMGTQLVLRFLWGGTRFGEARYRSPEVAS